MTGSAEDNEITSLLLLLKSKGGITNAKESLRKSYKIAKVNNV